MCQWIRLWFHLRDCDSNNKSQDSDDSEGARAANRRKWSPFYSDPSSKSGYEGRLQLPRREPSTNTAAFASALLKSINLLISEPLACWSSTDAGQELNNVMPRHLVNEN